MSSPNTHLNACCVEQEHTFHAAEQCRVLKAPLLWLCDMITIWYNAQMELASESNLFFHYSHELDGPAFAKMQVRLLGLGLIPSPSCAFTTSC